MQGLRVGQRTSPEAVCGVREVLIDDDVHLALWLLPHTRSHISAFVNTTCREIPGLRFLACSFVRVSFSSKKDGLFCSGVLRQVYFPLK